MIDILTPWRVLTTEPVYENCLAPEKPAVWNRKRVLRLHPFADQDRLLLEIISRGEFMINGLRNKDLHRGSTPQR